MISVHVGDPDKRVLCVLYGDYEECDNGYEELKNQIVVVFIKKIIVHAFHFCM